MLEVKETRGIRKSPSPAKRDDARKLIEQATPVRKRIDMYEDRTSALKTSLKTSLKATPRGKRKKKEPDLGPA